MTADMMICPDQAALEQTEEAFDGIGMDVAAHVFLFGMGYRFMRRGNLAHLLIVSRVVSHQVGIGGHLGFENRFQCCAGHSRNMERANLPAALDKRKDRILVRPSAARFLRVGFSAPKGFIRFYDLSAAADRITMLGFHRLADTMCHEPSRFVSHPKRAVQLMGAHTLFGGAKEMHSLKPDVQGNLRAFKDCADRNGKLLAAVFAFPHTFAVRLARKLIFTPRYKSIPMTCLVCGKEHLVKFNAVQRGRGKYCGRVCSDEAQRGKAKHV